MRFIRGFVASLVIAAACLTNNNINASKITSSSSLSVNDIDASVLKDSSSRLWSKQKLFDATTTSPSDNPYGFASTNNIYPPLPLPPHQPEPLPLAEQFSIQQLFGSSYPILVTMPFAEVQLRNPYSSPYNSTYYNTRADFPKLGVGQYTSIDLFGDEYFGLMRLIGANSEVIKRIHTVSSKFGGLTALEQKYPQFTQLLSQGHIYELDYFQLANVQDSPILESASLGDTLQNRYVAAPYVLLANLPKTGPGSLPGQRVLTPIAIQMEQVYTAGQTAILYRSDYYDSNNNPKPNVNVKEWDFAKTHVNAADNALHQLNAHLTRTHLVMENIVIATHLELPSSHIVFQLIVGEGHAHKTIALSDAARSLLLPGIIGETFAGGYGGAAIFVDSLFATYNWISDYVPNDLAARGFLYNSNIIEELSLLPNYFYGEDATTMWTIIRQYVERVLNHAYANDQAVANDASIQAWAALLATPSPELLTPPVPGFPSSFTTRSDLIDAVTASIYKGTVGHSVVNYAQTYYNVYQPLYPILSLWKPILKASDLGSGLVTEQYISQACGDVSQAQLGADIAIALGNQLALADEALPDDISLLQYATNAASAPSSNLQQSASLLLADLEILKSVIALRNNAFTAQNKPHLTYPFFSPENVANAIFS